MWHKIVEGNESTYPKVGKDVLLKVKLTECREQIVYYSGKLVKNTRYLDVDCCDNNVYNEFYFVDWAGDCENEDWELIAWHEIPTDEKCKWTYDSKLGVCLSVCAGLSYDKEDADYFIYCPRCGKEIEFV